MRVTAEIDAATAWMSPERRAFVAQIQDWLSVLHQERAWWREAFGEVVSHRGADNAEVFQLACIIGLHHSAFPVIFDLALDWLNDALNPALSDAAARNVIPVAYCEVMAGFHSHALALGERLADWSRRHGHAVSVAPLRRQ